MVIYSIYPANGYAVLMPSRKDTAEYLARMNDGMSFWQAGRGVPLRSRWNDEWEFVIDKSFKSPKGVGDFAEMNRLITAREKGYEFLKPLVGDAAEVLHGTYKGSRLWLFNITRQVPKERIDEMKDDAIFRVDPAGLQILCGPAFKDAVERSGLTGLDIEEADMATLC